MTALTKLLQEELHNAIRQSRGLHSRDINQDFLSTFKRVAKVAPEKIHEAVEIYVSNMKVHRSNATYSLYALCVLGDVSLDAKKIINSVFPPDELGHYEEDEDGGVRGNAKILRRILNGESLAKFVTKAANSKQAAVVTNVYGDHIAGDKISGNVFGEKSVNIIKSSNVSTINLHLEKLSAEIQKSYTKPDKAEVLQIVEEIRSLTDRAADKSAIMQKLGALLSRTAEVATIGTAVADIIAKMNGA